MMNHKIIYAFLVLTILLVITCKNKSQQELVPPSAEDTQADAQVYAVSIDGQILGQIPEPDSVRQANEERISKARNQYLQNLEQVKPYLMYAKANLINGTVENGIQVLTKGIDKFPNTADLYLMRAEALILTRQFAPAIQDLWKAGKAIESQPPSMGIDDVSDEEKRLAENLQYRIYRAMGHAFQYTGDMANSEKMWEIVGDFSNNPDLYCMAYYWQYQCYMRAGREADAADILKTVSANMSVMEITKPYLEALLYYKGELSANELVNPSFKPLSSTEAKPWLIKMYALGVKALLDKKSGVAADAFKTIIASKYWNQAPFIAAEVELNRMKGVNYKEPEEIKLNTKNKRK